MWTRRQFLRTSIGAITAAAGLGGYAWGIEPHWLEFVRHDLPLAGLPVFLRGKRLMQISDVHVGPRVSEDYLLESMARAAAFAPDIVVLTGDFISYGNSYDWDALARVVARIPRGRLGTFAICGNHDYGIEWSQPEVPARVRAVLEQYGIPLLQNETVVVDGLTIAGLDDLWGPNFRPAETLRRLPDDVDSIVLCHNPDAVDLPVFRDVRGWVLAGHTHGGQCKPPFLPPPVLPVRNHRYTAGPFDVGPGRMLYINRALGHALHVRFNVRPEITVFTLTNGSSTAHAGA